MIEKDYTEALTIVMNPCGLLLPERRHIIAMYQKIYELQQALENRPVSGLSRMDTEPAINHSVSRSDMQGLSSDRPSRAPVRRA